MTITWQQLLIGAILSAIISLVSVALKALNFSGALSAFIVGFCIFGFGGTALAVPLIVFFVSSSVLSKLWKRRKLQVSKFYGKTGCRDALQVWANGGVPALLSVAPYVFDHAMPARQAALLSIAAISAVNADTWSTEIGSVSSNAPVLLSTFRRVSPGTSGAVSILGLASGLIGAIVVVLSARLAWPAHSSVLLWRPDSVEIIALVWAGFVASFADSLLGAGLQAQFKCVACGKVTENRIHCGGPAPLARGLRWCTNDVVNLLTSMIGVIFASLLLSYFANPR